MEQLSATEALTKIVTNQTTELPPGPPLPEGYELGPLDICNGRGKSNWNVQGNVSFRNYIQQKVHHYINIKSKLEKTQFVNDTVHELRSQGYRFLGDINNRYFDIGDAHAKSKVGHSLRDQVAAIRKAINGGGVAPEPALLSAAAGESSAVVAPVMTTTLEDGPTVDTDEHRILLGKRTITAMEAADGAHAAYQEEAIAAASYHNLYTTSTATTTPLPPPLPGTITSVAATASSSPTTAAQPSAAKKLRRMHEDKVHLTALRTRLTQVIADLQHERRENARLTDENANLRKEAEKSRAEFFDLKTQVHNLSAVVRELWSRQGGTLGDLRFLSSDAVQVVAQTVGLPPNGQQPARDHDGEGDTSAMGAGHG